MAAESPRIPAREIFEGAVEIESASARQSYVQAACDGDSRLLEQVQGLLQAHDAAQFFLPDAPPPPSDVPEIGEKPGDRIGRYLLLEQIGAGGCGVVFLARQEEPVRRQVALKVIKLGMETKSVVARFEAERQALAMMDHLNIAKVFDAGATEAGRPFFVMELVNGLRITEYCDQNRATVRERLSLFVAVCQAIQHAHQKGIIHRDIKPSNVLVAVQDQTPIPKVIDFGIAKATESPLIDKTALTQWQGFLGTPAYMSPEQAQWGAPHIDTRTDIYSLGVLLYELLTGETPFNAQALLEGGGLDELRRIIREVPPLRPSTRVSRRSPASSGRHPAVALKPKAPSRPGPDDRELIHALKGDLDWIVMMCLEKDRARRYETANGLALDVRRYLEDQPILARPPSRLYHLRKLVQRNRGTFGALTTIAALLVIGVTVSSWQAVRARRAEVAEHRLRQEAEQNAREARESRERARLQAYTSDIRSAAAALQSSNLGQAQDLLRRYFPQPGERDLRGIEWRYAWQAARGDELQTFPQEHFVNCVRLSPTDQTVAIAGFGGDGTVVGTGSGRIVATFSVAPEQEMTDLMAFSPDGSLFAACGPREVVIRNTKNWKVRQAIESRSDALAFSPDNRTLAVKGDSGVGLYNPATGELRASIAAPGSGVGYLAFALEGRELALLRLPGSRVELWDVVTQEKTAEFGGIEGARRMIVSPNGRWLAVGNIAGELLVWDVRARTLVLKQKAHARWLFAMAFSPDGSTLATGGGDQVIHLWDTSMLPKSNLGKRATLRGHRSEVWSLAFSRDGALLASGSKDGTVKLWNAQTSHEPPNLLTLPRGGTLLLGLVPQSNQLLMLPPEANELQLWDAVAFTMMHSVPVRPCGAVIFNPPVVFLGTTNGTAEIWKIPAGERVRMIRLTDGPLMALGGSTDQRFLVAWDETRGIAALWDLRTGQRLTSFPDFDTAMATGSWRKSQRFAFSPDNRWMAYASTNFTVKIRDLQKGIETFTLPGHAWHVDCLRFSPDSSRLATGSAWDAEARVWNVATGRDAIPPLKGHLSGIGSLSFSADGRTLAVWSGEDLHFWSLENSAQMLTIPNVAAWFFNIIGPGGNAVIWEEGAFSGHFRIHYLPTLVEIDRSERGR